MTEDLSPFFADFGVDGTLAGQAVRVIFDGPGAAAQLNTAEAMVSQPQVQIATASVPAAPFGAALSIPQGNFTVQEHIPDGTGLSLLLLTAA